MLKTRRLLSAAALIALLAVVSFLLLPKQQQEPVSITESSLADDAAIESWREAVAMLRREKMLDRAAQEQQAIAEVTGSAADWRLTGDLYFGWMRTLEARQQPAENAARSAIAAYRHVLTNDPENLDVRTDLASAFLSSNEPMQAVEEIKRVLTANPDHVEARFNYGVMLARIGRLEQAVQQFERARKLTTPETSRYRQIEMALHAVSMSRKQ